MAWLSDKIKRLLREQSLKPMEFICAKCDEVVDAMTQKGECPHGSVKEFIYGEEEEENGKSERIGEDAGGDTSDV